MSRFKTLMATYRIATPMFCGGAGQEAELRLPSIKGALRFWWRTIQWGKIKDEKELWEKEAQLFGSSDQGIGQSKVRMRLEQVELKGKRKCGDVLKEGELKGAHYLGYGVMEAFASSKKNTKAGQLTREMIPGGQFSLSLRCGPNLPDSLFKEVKGALILLGTVGGLGSKSRKGYGSLTIVKLQVDGEGIPLDIGPDMRLKKVLSNLDRAQPKWSAWSKRSRVITVTKENSGLELLDCLGKEMIFFRSWGNNGKVLGEDREGNFKDDHDLSKGQSVEIDHPKRIVFGLPHNYGKGESKAVRATTNTLERRASPLFIHIDQIDDKSRPTAVICFLPSLFLPEGEKIRAFGEEVPLDRSEQFWDPIDGYLNRLLDAKNATSKKDNDLRAKEVDLGYSRS